MTGREFYRIKQELEAATRDLDALTRAHDEIQSPRTAQALLKGIVRHTEAHEALSNAQRQFQQQQERQVNAV